MSSGIINPSQSNSSLGPRKFAEGLSSSSIINRSFSTILPPCIPSYYMRCAECVDNMPRATVENNNVRTTTSTHPPWITDQTEAHLLREDRTLTIGDTVSVTLGSEALLIVGESHESCHTIYICEWCKAFEVKVMGWQSVLN